MTQLESDSCGCLLAGWLTTSPLSLAGSFRSAILALFDEVKLLWRTYDCQRLRVDLTPDPTLHFVFYSINPPNSLDGSTTICPFSS